MNFSFYIAKRYLKQGSGQQAINIISRIASVGIVMGTAALFIVLAVFAGLKTFSLSFVNDADPDLKLFPKEGKFFTISPQQTSDLMKIPGLVSFSKVIEERCFFVFDGKEHIAQLKGVDTLFNFVNSYENHLYLGQWFVPNTYQCVPGIGISSKLSLGMFDQRGGLEVYVPKPGKGLINSKADAFKTEILAPAGFYSISEDLDYKYVFIDLRLAQELMDYDANQISNLEVKVADETKTEQIAEQISAIFNGKVQVKTRMQLNESLYRMLNTENLMLYLIFTLIIIITLFTLIGALIMTIIDKKSHLKTLLNLGASMASLRKIFLLQGFFICTRGTLIGLVIGIFVVLMQSHFEVFMITDSMAYPVEFLWENVFLVVATILILGYLSAWLASSRVNDNLLNEKK
uniref:ABC transporter permease n=1 Tax=Flavobacterium sp. TaxID=239 RepID=UPI00404A72CD